MVLSIQLATSNTTIRFSCWGGAFWQLDVAFIVHVIVEISFIKISPLSSPPPLHQLAATSRSLARCA